MAKSKPTNIESQYEGGKTPSYLSAKKLLTDNEYEQYRKARETIGRLNLKNRLGELKSESKYRTNLETYKKTRSGKVGGFMSKAFGVASERGGVTRALYRRTGQLPPTNVANRFKTIQGKTSGRIGRPKGTLDKRYAQYGGVYEFRKAMAQKRKIERMQLLRSIAVSPRQQEVLRRIEARDNYNQQNPEGKAIPDTSGGVFMSGIMDEINRASNLVG